MTPFLKGKERNAPSLVSARHTRASSTHPNGRSPRNSPLITNHQTPVWRRAQLPIYPNTNPTTSLVPWLFLSLIPDVLRTVLAVKGSLRRARLRRALDRSGPFSNTPLFLR
jgi:hypothetical protein